jgi:hypothetical protein
MAKVTTTFPVAGEVLGNYQLTLAGPCCREIAKKRVKPFGTPCYLSPLTLKAKTRGFMNSLCVEVTRIIAFHIQIMASVEDSEDEFGEFLAIYLNTQGKDGKRNKCTTS